MAISDYHTIRRYIAGEEFDPIKYTKEHLIRLTKTVPCVEEFNNFPPEIQKNHLRRIQKYLQNHEKEKDWPECQALQAAYDRIAREYHG